MDALKVAAVFTICLILPFGFAGLWGWFYFWCVVAFALALGEYLSKKINGKMLSQIFWEWKEGHKVEAMVIGLGMLVFWLFLFGHLFLKW